MDTQVILVIISLIVGIGSGLYSFTRSIGKDSGEQSEWKGMMEQRVKSLEHKDSEQDHRMDKIDNFIKDGFKAINEHIDSKFSELKEDWKEQIKQLISALRNNR